MSEYIGELIRDKDNLGEDYFYDSNGKKLFMINGQFPIKFLPYGLIYDIDGRDFSIKWSSESHMFHKGRYTNVFPFAIITHNTNIINKFSEIINYGEIEFTDDSNKYEELLEKYINDKTHTIQDFADGKIEIDCDEKSLGIFGHMDYYKLFLCKLFTHVKNVKVNEISIYSITASHYYLCEEQEPGKKYKFYRMESLQNEAPGNDHASENSNS